MRHGFDQPRLLRHDKAPRDRAPDKEQNRAINQPERIKCRRRQKDQLRQSDHHDRPLRPDLVCQIPAKPVSKHGANTENKQDDRHPVASHAEPPFHNRGDKGEHHIIRADHRRRNRHCHHWHRRQQGPAQNSKRCRLKRDPARHDPQQPDHGNHQQNRHRPERALPPQRITKITARRHAEHLRNRNPAENSRQRHRPSLGRNRTCSHCRRIRRIHPCTECRQNARDKNRLGRSGERTRQGRDKKDAERNNHQVPPVKPACQCYQDR